MKKLLWFVLIFGIIFTIIFLFFLKPVLHQDTIRVYARLYNEDPLLVAAIIKVESKFYPKARSHRGAIGLMQMMPSTAKEIAEELKIRPFELSALENPSLNIRFGCYYLAKLRKDFRNDNPTVLAAYNGGAKNVRDWLKSKNKRVLTPEDIEFNETRKFVRDVLTTYHWLQRIQYLRNKLENNGKS